MRLVVSGDTREGRPAGRPANSRASVTAGADNPNDVSAGVDPHRDEFCRSQFLWTAPIGQLRVGVLLSYHPASVGSTLPIANAEPVASRQKDIDGFLGAVRQKNDVSTFDPGTDVAAIAQPIKRNSKEGVGCPRNVWQHRIRDPLAYACHRSLRKGATTEYGQCSRSHERTPNQATTCADFLLLSLRFIHSIGPRSCPRCTRTLSPPFQLIHKIVPRTPPAPGEFSESQFQQAY